MCPLVLAHVTSGKTLLQRIEERGRFPSAGQRFCTSDFKRSPIERELRRHLRAHPRFNNLIVNAMGMRAEESPARSRLAPWRRSDRNSRAGREWFDWLPIHGLKTPDVFRVIHEAGQSPHWAYAAGMSRLSCVFCILASRADLAPGCGTSPRATNGVKLHQNHRFEVVVFRDVFWAVTIRGWRPSSGSFCPL